MFFLRPFLLKQPSTCHPDEGGVYFEIDPSFVRVTNGRRGFETYIHTPSSSDISDDMAAADVDGILIASRDSSFASAFCDAASSTITALSVISTTCDQSIRASSFINPLTKPPDFTWMVCSRPVSVSSSAPLMRPRSRPDRECTGRPRNALIESFI
jgi:hypothetical protein